MCNQCLSSKLEFISCLLEELRPEIYITRISNPILQNLSAERRGGSSRVMRRLNETMLGPGTVYVKFCPYLYRDVPDVRTFHVQLRSVGL
jgi:hypothetical protein